MTYRAGSPRRGGAAGGWPPIRPEGVRRESGARCRGAPPPGRGCRIAPEPR